MIWARAKPPRYRLETPGGSLIETRSGGFYGHRAQATIDARAEVASKGRPVVIRERRGGRYEVLERFDIDSVIIAFVPRPKLHEQRSAAWFDDLAELCEAHARRWTAEHPPAAQVVADGLAAAWAAEAGRARKKAEDLRNEPKRTRRAARVDSARN